MVKAMLSQAWEISRVNLKNLFKNVSKNIGKIRHFGKSGHLKILNAHLLVLFKTFPIQSIRGVTFYLGNLATGHFSRKFFSKVSTSGHEGSIDTDLKSLSCPESEPIKV